MLCPVLYAVLWAAMSIVPSAFSINALVPLLRPDLLLLFSHKKTSSGTVKLSISIPFRFLLIGSVFSFSINTLTSPFCPDLLLPTFPLCCFDQLSCWLPKDISLKCIKINGFWPCRILSNALLEPQAEDKPWHLRCRSLQSGYALRNSQERSTHNLLCTKNFHAVPSASPHVCSLKSRYGKVRFNP